MDVQIHGVNLEKLGRIPKNSEKSYQYLILRLLLGTATVSRGSIKGRQKIDYSSLPSIPQTKSPSVAIKDFLASYAVGGDLVRFIRVTVPDNRDFYREILNEFINFHLQNVQGRHTGAFIFLYRILERISYSVPLLYASTQTDYIGTFNDLKAILNADVKGELGLFNKFLSQGKFIDKLKLQVNQKISFASASGHGISHFNLVCEKFDKFSSFDPNMQEVEIKLRDIPNFLITIRNRFFHSGIGDWKKNITLVEMPDPDEFFGKINPIIISFLSIVVLHTISAKYQM